MADLEVPVLIVGSSLVGMSTALLLGHHGIPALAVEHHRGTAIHPRAAQITQRSMEILRVLGIEQIVRQKSDEQFVQDGAIMAVETLAGKELGYFIANLNEGIRDVSPCERVFISQSLLEPLLKARAGELGAELGQERSGAPQRLGLPAPPLPLRGDDGGMVLRRAGQRVGEGVSSSELGLAVGGHGQEGTGAGPTEQVTEEQQGQWDQVRAAARLQPVLPAFQALNIL